MITEGSAFEYNHITPLGLFCFFILMLSAEYFFPLRRRKWPFKLRFVINICITILAFVVGTLAVRPVALAIAEWVSGNDFGLVAKLPVPGAVQIGIGFILMDATFYYWHRANHVIPVLWRFHKVHHIDPDLDVSTAFRFHFGEVLYSTGFRAVQVFLLGIIPTTYIIYEIVFQCANMFHHSNLRLPIGLERCLSILVVTPRMHGIHHSQIRNEMNSNYSVVFRCWDWLHRTLRLDVAQSGINIGVKGYQQKEDNKLWNLLAIPFRKSK